MSASSIDDGEKTARALSRASLVLCLLVFLVFVANVLLGKAKLVFGLASVPVLSDIIEYLLLMATALLFAVATLLREWLARRAEDRHPQGPENGTADVDTARH